MRCWGREWIQGICRLEPEPLNEQTHFFNLTIPGFDKNDLPSKARDVN